MIIRIVIAGACTAVGVAGLLIPILPGWLFLILGVLVLFPSSRFTTSALNRLEVRLPRVARVLRRLIVGNKAAHSRVDAKS